MILELNLDDSTEDMTIKLWHSAGSKPTDTITTDLTRYNENIKNHGTFVENSLLPPAVRYIDYSQGVVLFERPPCYVTFNFSPFQQQRLSLDGASKKALLLPIPWQRYVAFLGSNGLPSALYVFFSGHQIENLTDDPMCLAPLPNIYQNCSVCLPIYNHVDDVHYDLMDALSNIYNIVWRSGFNLDVWHCAYTWNSQMGKKNPLNNVVMNDNQVQWYTNWASLSLEEIMTYDWNCPGYGSFNTLLTTHKEQQSNDYHDTVVDLYLAAKG